MTTYTLRSATSIFGTNIKVKMTLFKIRDFVLWQASCETDPPVMSEDLDPESVDSVARRAFACVVKFQYSLVRSLSSSSGASDLLTRSKQTYSVF
jgi:hypothetical protein